MQPLLTTCVSGWKPQLDRSNFSIKVRWGTRSLL
jgi:hypothetical protein